MSEAPSLHWQTSLFDDVEEPAFDEAFSQLERIELDPESWVDYASGWLSGSSELFAELVASKDWGQRTRRIHDKTLPEPRLTWSWRAASEEALEPVILERMRAALSDHYGIEFDSCGLNLYRDGRDSVAWHGDHISKEIDEPIVVLVSLGEPRKFLLKPREGGSSRAFHLGHGDLLVTGGRTQRTWLHSVPKVAEAGPRISIAYRHGMYRPNT